MESVQSSRRHGKRGGKFVFKIRKRVCSLLHHYTLRLCFRKSVYGLGSARSVTKQTVLTGIRVTGKLSCAMSKAGAGFITTETTNNETQKHR